MISPRTSGAHLTDQISDSELTELLALPSSPQDACDALVQLALDRGGKDNVTIILAEFGVEQRTIRG